MPLGDFLAGTALFVAMLAAVVAATALVVRRRLAHLDPLTRGLAAVVVGTAVLIGVFRLARKQPVRHAVNGIFGIAVGAILAWRTGDAKNFYLPGILITLAQVAIFLVSVVVRRPIVGYVWGVLANGGKHDWYQNPATKVCQPVPRHNEINEYLARSILRKLSKP